MKDLTDEKIKFDLIEQKLKAELQILQGSFNTYKTNLEAEFDASIKKKETQLKDKHEKALNESIQNVRNKLGAEKDKELRDLMVRQRNEMDTMKYQVTQDSEFKSDSMNNFNSTIRDLKYEHEMASDEIKSLKDQLEYQKSIYDKLALKLKQNENILAEKNNEYNFLKSNLDDKVKDVEERFSEDLDNMMQEASQLRMMYLKKCDELYNERQIITSKIMEKANITKEYLKKKLLKTKYNANISLAPHNARIPWNAKPVTKKRRSSLPTTDAETFQAELTAGNIESVIRIAKKRVSNNASVPSKGSTDNK